ncbi:MAG: hypothetical protein AAF577_10920 [Pseudomonadota bacterium]
MTADNRDTAAFEKVMAAIRKIRESWLLATFMVGAGVWAYDAWQAHGPLPIRVNGLEQRLEAMEQRAMEAPSTVIQRPVLLPGMVAAGRAGDRVTAVVPSPLAPAAGCETHEVKAAVTDAAGNRRPVQAALVAGGGVTDGMAVTLRLHPGLTPGPASLALRLMRRCGPLGEMSETTGMALTVLP